MSEMQGRERFLPKLAGRETDRLPVFCADQTATFEQMEEMQAFWPEAHCQAVEMVKLAMGAYTVLGFDAVRVPFCQTIEAEVLGAKPKYAGKEGLPSIVEHPYKIGEPVQPLPDNFLSLGRIPELAVTTLFSGRPEDVEQAAVAAAQAGYDILAPGCSIAPGSPLGNLRAMVSGAVKAAG